MVKKIDIGCGSKPKEGYIGLDCEPGCSPDILCDVNEGIIFTDLEAVWMDNSLEHVKDPIYLIKECHDALRLGGKIEIIIPNLQWWPLLILSWFTDLHRFWNWWMRRKKNRGIHYTMWTPYTLQLAVRTAGFYIVEKKGWHLGKEFYIKAVK